MKHLLFVIVALVAVTSLSLSQTALVSTKVNGFNVLVSAAKVSTDSTSTVYSGVINGSSINGRKIVVGYKVSDTASAGTTTTAPTVDIDLQGSFDGTNFFTVDDAVVDNDRIYGSTYATPGAGVSDLSNWNLPYYRLALIPSANIGNTHSQYTDGKFKFYVAGLP